MRPLATGRFEWRRETVQIHGEDEVDVVHGAPARAAPGSGLSAHGSAPGGHPVARPGASVSARALDELGAALRFLRVDDGRLYLSPSAEDLEAIAPGGFVRAAAESLRAMADDAEAPARDLAARALLRLYVEHRKLSAR